MHRCSAVLCEQLGQFEDCRQPAMTMKGQPCPLVPLRGQDLPGITVRHNWSHVVNVRSSFSLFSRQLPSRIPLLPIVHLLRLEQPLDLVRHCVVGVVTEIRRDFVGGRQQRRACPARDIQDLLVGGLLGHLYGINGTHYEVSVQSESTAARTAQELTGVHWLTSRRPFFQQIEQFPRHQRAGICLLQRAPLAHDVRRGVGPLDALVTRGIPPCLHIANLLFEKRILSGARLVCGRQELECVGRQCRGHRGLDGR